MNEETLTHLRWVLAFPHIPECLSLQGGEEPPPRGALLVPLKRSTFSAQGAPLLLLPEDKNTASRLGSGCLLGLDFSPQSPSVFKTNAALFIQKKEHHRRLWQD